MVNDPVIRQLADDGVYLGITAWVQLAEAECGAIYPPTASTAGKRLRLYAARYPIMDEEHRGGTVNLLTATTSPTSASMSRRGFPDTLPPVGASTADVAEVRFHGRNSQAWAVRDASRRRSYAYDYGRKNSRNGCRRLARCTPGEGRFTC